MELDAILGVYDRYARHYDRVFGPVLQPGRKTVIERMQPSFGDRILEVGVGTGLSLPLYPAGVRVTGIDIAPQMLARAQARCDRHHLTHVAALHRMDAEAMDFPDNSFDKVVAMYVASVVPNPAQLVSEMRRVCRDGGELYIVNHFRHPSWIIGGFERLVAPLTKRMGFHPDMCLETFSRDSGLQRAGRSPVNFFGYWTLLHQRNDKSAAANRRAAQP